MGKVQTLTWLPVSGPGCCFQDGVWAKQTAYCTQPPLGLNVTSRDITVLPPHRYVVVLDETAETFHSSDPSRNQDNKEQF